MPTVGDVISRVGPYPQMFMVEPSRAVTELGALLVSSPLLAGAPRGDGHPVLVLPGMLGTDLSTAPLRAFLRYLGYPVHGWRAGRGVGVREAVREGMTPALERLTDRYQRPASVIGWCVGGFYARRLTQQRPDLVRQTITLGTPFRLAPTGAMPDVPTSAFFSRTDGMVPWTACRARPGVRRENIAVTSSHLGMGHNPSVLWALADRLAQDVEQWRPFVPPKSVRGLYPQAA